MNKGQRKLVLVALVVTGLSLHVANSEYTTDEQVVPYEFSGGLEPGIDLLWWRSPAFGQEAFDRARRKTEGCLTPWERAAPQRRAAKRKQHLERWKKLDQQAAITEVINALQESGPEQSASREAAREFASELLNLGYRLGGRQAAGPWSSETLTLKEDIDRLGKAVIASRLIDSRQQERITRELERIPVVRSDSWRIWRFYFDVSPRGSLAWGLGGPAACLGIALFLILGWRDASGSTPSTLAPPSSEHD